MIIEFISYALAFMLGFAAACLMLGVRISELHKDKEYLFETLKTVLNENDSLHEFKKLINTRVNQWKN